MQEILIYSKFIYHNKEGNGTNIKIKGPLCKIKQKMQFSCIIKY